MAVSRGLQIDVCKLMSANWRWNDFGMGRNDLDMVRNDLGSGVKRPRMWGKTTWGETTVGRIDLYPSHTPSALKGLVSTKCECPPCVCLLGSLLKGFLTWGFWPWKDENFVLGVANLSTFETFFIKEGTATLAMGAQTPLTFILWPFWVVFLEYFWFRFPWLGPNFVYFSFFVGLKYLNNASSWAFSQNKFFMDNSFFLVLKSLKPAVKVSVNSHTEFHHNHNGY